MESIQLKCPLCCNHFFSSCESLKLHILNFIDKLHCPICKEKFNKICELVSHLDKKCQDNGRDLVVNSNNSQEHVKESRAKCDQLDDYLLAKTLDDEHGTDIRVSEQVAGSRNEEDAYFCSSCSISFPSIEEHLQKFHEGDAVLLDDGVSTMVDSDGKVYFGNDLKSEDNNIVENDVLLTDENSATKKSFLKIDSEDEDLDDFDEILMKTEAIKPIETLKQEDCYDKDGRLYTRKMVKIEKFWDENMLIDKKKFPIIENYLVDGNKAIKLTLEEANKVEDKLKLIEIYKCESCSVQFSRKDYLKHHCQLSRLPKHYKCSKCSLVFDSPKLLCNHMKKYKTLAPNNPNLSEGNTCEICNTDFPTFKSLRLHKRMHEPVKIREAEAPVPYGITGETVGPGSQSESREMFTCDICHKAYDLQYKAVHMNFHNEENNFDCDICNRKFYTKTNLEMHVRVHSNEKKYVCSHCKKGFLTFKSMRDHIKNLCQSRKYECQFCGRRFARPHEKVKHERIHTGEKPHVCEICGKAFRVSYCLTLHMRTHSGTRPYQCPHCSKRFKAHSVYNHHLLTHSEERNYKCPYCPKAFKTGVQLAGHKNSHTKPFTCTQCNRPFASLYAVRTHMESHKRENNLKYNCWLCGASYAREFALRDHLKEQHPEEGDLSTDDILQRRHNINKNDAILVQTDEDMLIQLEEAAAIIKIEVPSSD